MFKKRSVSFTGFSVALILCGAAQLCHAEPNLQELLESSDQARAGGLPGLIWDVRAVNSGSAANIDNEPAVLRLKATGEASLAEYLEPLRSKGSRILQVGRNMWFSKRGLRKPVAISPRQRLTGEAAIGDIATTNYSKDYKAKYLQEDKVDGEKCYVLDLTAARDNATYDRIIYWVSAARHVGVHAEFLSVSGKRLKKAEFEYGNKIHFEGKETPFISKMTIADELTDAKTTLEFMNVKIETVPRSTFDVTNLQ